MNSRFCWWVRAIDEGFVVARIKSPGCGIQIIVLIALALAIKYWYVLVAFGFVALVIRAIVLYVKNWKPPVMPETKLDSRSETVSTVVAGAKTLFDTSRSNADDIIVPPPVQNQLKLLGKSTDRHVASTNSAQVNTEIENVSSAENAVTYADVAEDKPYTPIVTARESSAEGNVHNINEVVFVLAEKKRVHDAGNGHLLEHFATKKADVSAGVAAEKETVDAVTTKEKLAIKKRTDP